MKIVNKLIKLANALDSGGFVKEADCLDSIIKKFAGSGNLNIRGIPVSYLDNFVTFNNKKYTLTGSPTLMGQRFWPSLEIISMSYQEADASGSNESLRIEGKSTVLGTAVMQTDVLGAESIDEIYNKVIEEQSSNFVISGDGGHVAFNAAEEGIA